MLYLYTKAHAAWINRDQGASAVEYGLLIAGIAAVLVVIIFTFGSKLSDLFNNTCGQITKGGVSGSTCK